MQTMNLKRHLLETATLVAAAVLCALVSNALAGRERKLALVGNYPNALKVPKQETEKTETTEKTEKTGDSLASSQPHPRRRPGELWSSSTVRKFLRRLPWLPHRRLARAPPPRKARKNCHSKKAPWPRLEVPPEGHCFALAG